MLFAYQKHFFISSVDALAELKISYFHVIIVGAVVIVVVVGIVIVYNVCM